MLEINRKNIFKNFQNVIDKQKVGGYTMGEIKEEMISETRLIPYRRF